MRLLVMRHGIAVPLGEIWEGERIEDDAARPLSDDGRKRTKQAARGLKECDARPDLIATSPLRRALETAEIVQSVWQKPSPRLETWPELELADSATLLQHLQSADAETVLLVGHEPGLGRFVSRLLTASPSRLHLDFKKAAVCALDIELGGARPWATLLWHATPGQLRLMRK